MCCRVHYIESHLSAKNTPLSPIEISRAAKVVTAQRKQLVQQSRPWEKAPTYLKAQTRKAGAQARLTTTQRRTRKRPPAAPAPAGPGWLGRLGLKFLHCPADKTCNKSILSEGSGHDDDL